MVTQQGLNKVGIVGIYVQASGFEDILAGHGAGAQLTLQGAIASDAVELTPVSLARCLEGREGEGTGSGQQSGGESNGGNGAGNELHSVISRLGDSVDLNGL